MRRDEDFKGLVGSILLHALAALALFFWQVDTSTGTPEFLEVSLGTVNGTTRARPAPPSLPGSEAGSPANASSGRNIEDLPERKFLMPDDEVLTVPAGRKLDVLEAPSRSRTRLADRSVGRKDRPGGTGIGSRERFATPGRGDYAGAVAAPAGGSGGSGVGQGVSMSMSWSGGGTRKKLSGDLPEYPEGVNVSAQIRVATVVMPDGTVGSLKPLQKGNTKLEEAAMNAVRRWRFEPLPRSAPQREQTCTITFNFRLR